jgi:hypothetical protein
MAGKALLLGILGMALGRGHHLPRRIVAQHTLGVKMEVVGNCWRLVTREALIVAIVGVAGRRWLDLARRGVARRTVTDSGKVVREWRCQGGD